MSAIRARRRWPPPWAGLAALIGVVGLLLWAPSWSFSGLLAPLGFACIAVGWRSAPRRWLLLVALALNTLLLLITGWTWLDKAFG